MNALAFDDAPAGATPDGKLVRRANFAPRSALPLSAACAVGAAMRERLGTLLATAISVTVVEPLVPSPHAWAEIVSRARVFRVVGTAGEAAILFRPRDALALAAASFGEDAARTSVRSLSALEDAVLERTANAVAGTLGAICGERLEFAGAGEPGGAAFTSYFEVCVDAPLQARIGVAVTREPLQEPRGGLTFEDLSGVPLRGALAIDLGVFPAAALAALSPGEIVPITSRSAFRGSLRIHGRTVATGTCGVRDGRYALEVEGKRL